MTFNHIYYFLEVAKNLNFSMAAQNLYITQPSLGRQISALEKELNMQLFTRNTRNVKLTPAGQYLYEQWSRQMQCFEDIITSAKKINEGYSGKLFVGILEGLDLGKFWSEIICSFEKSFPNIKLHMKQYSFGELREKLLKEELDGIVTYSFDIMDLDAVCYKNLYHYTPCWAIPTSNPLSQKDCLCITDFKDEEILLIDSKDSPRGNEILRRICQEAGISPRITYMDSLEEIILRLETGNQCTLINDALRIAKSPVVKTFPFEDVFGIGYFAFACRKSSNNRCLKLLEDHINHQL